MTGGQPFGGQKQIGLIALCLAAIFAVLAYLYWSGACDKQSCGQFGDFLGGVLNPVIGAVTLCALVWTVRAQTETLHLTKAALELAKKEAHEEAQRAELQRLEAQSKRESDSALENYSEMKHQMERVLSIPMFSLGAATYSLLQVIEGAAEPDCLGWWQMTPVEEMSARNQLYAQNLVATLELTVSAAEHARRYLPREQWEAEKRQLGTMIAACFSLNVLNRLSQMSNLLSSIGVDSVADHIRRFDGTSNRRP